MKLLPLIQKTKRAEIAYARQKTPLSELEKKQRDAPPTRSFLGALEKKSREKGYALIAEIKKASPSRGVIREDFDPPAIARAYEEGGAACLSILTDQPWFQGSFSDLAAARDACSLPILRKDFILDPYQVYEARVIGADCVLLIMAILSDDDAQRILDVAIEAGMDALLEVHTAAELTRARALRGVSLIGVNNRNLDTFVVSLEVSRSLAKDVPQELFLISESGIKTKKDYFSLLSCGFRGFLVGESLMRADDLAHATQTLADGV